MKKFLICVVVVVMCFMFIGATATPTAGTYEIKFMSKGVITAKTKNGTLPKPIATYFTSIMYDYDTDGNAIYTVYTNSLIAKAVQTKISPTYQVTLVSVKPVLTSTVTPTITATAVK